MLATLPPGRSHPASRIQLRKHLLRFRCLAFLTDNDVSKVRWIPYSPQGGCDRDRQSLGAANGSSATVAAVTLGPPPQLVLFGETSSVPPFLLLVLRRPRPLGLGLTILFAPGGISFTFINEAGMAGMVACLGTLAPEVNNFAHQRNLLQNVYYYCSYQEELEFLKSDWS